MGRGAGEERGGGGTRRGAWKEREAAAGRSGEPGRRERESGFRVRGGGRGLPQKCFAGGFHKTTRFLNFFLVCVEINFSWRVYV